MPQDHPTAEELHKFIDGDLDGAANQRILALIDSDPSVAKTIDVMVDSAAFTRAFTETTCSPKREAGADLDRLITKWQEGDFSPIDLKLEANLLLDEPIRDDSPGSLGKFEIREVVAAGGMGVVFSGYDPELDRRVAIKALGSQWRDDSDSREQFVREARASAALNHPNIVPIHSVEEGQHTPYFVMPFLDKTLGDRVREGGPLPGNRGRTRCGDHPPRHQARQPDVRCRERARLRRRLRHRPAR